MIEARDSETNKPIARDSHVRALTVGSTVRFRGKEFEANEEQRHLLTFHLRQMWVATLVENLIDEVGNNWVDIRAVTGKTRQSFGNLTRSGYVTKEIVDLPHDSRERAEAFKTSKYRPVSNAFIRSVCHELEKEGYVIMTNKFREAFDIGLTVGRFDVMEGFGAGSEWIRRRMGANWFDFVFDHLGIGRDTEVLSCIRNEKTNEIHEFRAFPMVRKSSHEQAILVADEALADIELLAFDYADEETLRPNDQCRYALERWAIQQGMQEDFDDVQRKMLSGVPGVRTGALKARNQKTVPIKVGVTKPKDSEDLGHFIAIPQIYVRITPDMVNDFNQVGFNVVVQLDGNRMPITAFPAYNPHLKVQMSGQNFIVGDSTE